MRGRWLQRRIPVQLSQSGTDSPCSWAGRWLPVPPTSFRHCSCEFPSPVSWTNKLKSQNAEGRALVVAETFLFKPPLLPVSASPASSRCFPRPRVARRWKLPGLFNSHRDSALERLGAHRMSSGRCVPWLSRKSLLDSSEAAARPWCWFSRIRSSSGPASPQHPC